MLVPSPAPAPPAETHGILRKFAFLLSARWLREGLQAVFLVYLARTSAVTFGEFMLALETGAILLLLAEFGLNLPLVGRLSAPGGNPAEALAQVSVLKAALLALAWGGVWGLVTWQGYSSSLRAVVLILSAGVGLEALASTFFVSLQVAGLQPLEGKIRGAAALLGFAYAAGGLAAGASPMYLAFFKSVENLAALLMVALALARTGRWRWRRPTLAGLRAMARQGWVFGLMALTTTTYAKVNLFFLQRYGGSGQVAQYSATWPLVDGAAVLTASLLMQGVLYPLFVQVLQVDRREVSRLAQDAARWLLLSALILMFALASEADRLIPLIFGPHYLEAVRLQPYLVFVIPFDLLHVLAEVILLSLGLQRLLLLIFLAGLGFNLALCSLIIPFAPLAGAALAVVLTKTGVACLTVTLAQRRLGLLPGRDLPRLPLAALAGLALYFSARPFLPRELAEIAALGPLLGLGWWWYVRGGPGDHRSLARPSNSPPNPL